MDLVEARLQGFEATSRHPWERARLALVSRLIARHTPIQPGHVVLDVGCGDTFVVESLARRFPAARFYAVDSAFTPELIATFTSRLTVTNVSLYASLDDVPQEDRVSLILLMDVLEHVQDDRGLLRDMAARPYVDRTTRLLITVPSYARLFCAHDRFLGHYRRYTRQTLDAMLRSADFAAIDAGHFFASLVPIRVLQVLKERVITTTIDDVEGLASWRSGDTLGRVLAGILEWDGRFGLALQRIGVPLPGLSTFAICKPSA